MLKCPYIWLHWSLWFPSTWRKCLTPQLPLCKILGMFCCLISISLYPPFIMCSSKIPKGPVVTQLWYSLIAAWCLSATFLCFSVSLLAIRTIWRCLCSNLVMEEGELAGEHRGHGCLMAWALHEGIFWNGICLPHFHYMSSVCLVN